MAYPSREGNTRMSDFTRRDMLKTGMLAVGLLTPPWLASIAKADMLRQGKGASLDPDAVLVVVQLTGGNDGLNTVVPVGSDLYYQMRPNLAIGKDEALSIGRGLALHPAMSGLKELFDRQQVAIIQNVGYPNRNRSHFRSMDIWQSASPEDDIKNGWVGRHLDERLAKGPLSPVAAIGLSTEKPRALTAARASIPCFASLADIKSMVGDPASEKLLRDVQGSLAGVGSSQRAVQQASISALDAIALLNSRLESFQPKGAYPNHPFGNGFKQIAQLVGVSPQTRVIYLSVGGFDTHSRQSDQHRKLLEGLSQSLLAFQQELEAMGKADKVLTMVFSEFGRRTYENGSAGTDHGSAAPMFLVGKRVKGGVYGPNPDLANLDGGDVAFKTDFRRIYATALDSWLGGDSKTVLGGSFSQLDLIK
jgi:uncharacterized protein (DUF1501 family)